MNYLIIGISIVSSIYFAVKFSILKHKVEEIIDERIKEAVKGAIRCHWLLGVSDVKESLNEHVLTSPAIGEVIQKRLTDPEFITLLISEINKYQLDK